MKNFLFCSLMAGGVIVGVLLGIASFFFFLVSLCSGEWLMAFGGLIATSIILGFFLSIERKGAE